MIIQKVTEVLRIEAEGILNLIDRIDDNFVKMVDLIYNSTGRVIVAGIGKSGIIGRKIVATFNSTGTRSIFLHPVEAIHGDLGIVSREDVFLALSNSGETDELNIMLPSIRKIGCSIIAFTGNKNSTLAKNSDIVIDAGVEKEACPLGMAPTASTTALLAMGDALAVILINKKHFKKSDFKKNHPGGMLGRRLSCKVKDIMLTGDVVPCVDDKTSVKQALTEMNRFELGAILITKTDGILTGIITDGDIRRLIIKEMIFFDGSLQNIMTENPRTVQPESPVYDALNLMEEHQITVLPVINSTGKVQGILHLHDILGKGAFKFNAT
ncbi:MAG: KpsF/GutQ family sugar-phosphate isomerase [Deltaproteobacteria bacterium]|nr:KpsF/GutQ family sugar-phosphate isomerase [Deltaproteobacteria bacterium]MBW2100055.1 KpsF/GutQ family sugar-phosphate isomerase [Deltaproteobacteria bacterium]